MLALSAMIFINAAYEIEARVQEPDDFAKRYAGQLRITGAGLVIFSITSMMFFTLGRIL